MMETKFSGLRFKVGTQVCGVCKTKENIIQIENSTIIKGLPVIELGFLCKDCLEKLKEAKG